MSAPVTSAARWFAVACAIGIGSACASTPDPAVVDAPSASVTSSTTPAATKPRAPTLDAALEVDRRVDDPATGQSFSSRGVTLTFPASWKVQTDERGTVGTAPSTTSTVYLGFEGAAPTGAVPAAVLERLGVRGCEWTPPIKVAVGPKARDSTLSEGKCERDGVGIHGVWLREEVSHLLLVGIWEERGDGLAWLGSIRTLVIAIDARVKACCDALQAGVSSAPPMQKIVFAAGFAACRERVSDPNVLPAIRNLLGSIEPPDACR